MTEKEEKPEAQGNEEETFSQAIESLTESISEVVKENYNDELRPFEAVEGEIKKNVRDNMMEFRERFAKGYQVLLAEIAGQSGEEVIDPGMKI